jgi:ABC-type transport system involved in cytochrome c biogenesis permease subunit
MATAIDIEVAEKPEFSFPQTSRSAVWRGVLAVLKVLASLKITVALFALAVFIVFVGTLAQTEHDIWKVVHTYFRSGFVWIPFQVFFPKSFFPNLPPIPGIFPFFGGWTIGGIMAVNLLAAHLVRFKVQSRGRRLLAGLGIIALGCVVTWGVIAAGSGSGFQATLVLDPSMRILWQLLQGGFAGLILLAGCWIVFAKRAGIVLLHSGVGLLMFSELLVGTTAIEAQMHIVEGETVNFVQDIRANELAVIDASGRDEDQVVVVPEWMLVRGSKLEHAWLPAWFYEPLPESWQIFLGCTYGEKTIRHEYLPFDIKVVKYLQNSELGAVEPGTDNLATAGVGLEMAANEVKAGTGTSSTSEVDESAVYVEILKKGTSESLGTYLLSLVQSRLNESRERSGLSEAQLRARTGPFILKMSEPVTVKVDDKPYRLALRFKRMYKPYSLTLNDVRSDKYMGTDTPKDYSSLVHLRMDSPDPALKVDRDDVRIWMNNPLRFHGETFYQSNVGVDPITREETTGLQVVTNTGWMIPYVSCMIVAVGMLFQFSVTLMRFLNRLQATATPLTYDTPAEKGLVVGIPVLCALMVAYHALPPRPKEESFDLYAAGKIPVMYQGRMKPLDTLARNSLQVMSNRETFKDENKKSQPAIRWLFDVISGSPAAEKHRVFRIDNLDVLERLGLEWREGHLYSLDEIRTKAEEFNSDAEKAQKKRAEQLTVYERKLLELDRRIRAFTAIDAAFRRPDLPEPDEHIREMSRERRGALVQRLSAAEESLRKGHPPLAVPVRIGSEYEWKPLVSAFTRDYFEARVFEDRPPDPATAGWDAILSAYLKDAPQDFNKAVAKYEVLLAREAPPPLAASATNYEAYFNQFNPLHCAWILYIIGFVVSAIAWLGWTRPIIKAAFWLNVFTLSLHTFALISRIYISGRPPVTNLYSTAPFIGWGCVILALIFERIFRIGIGNIVATIGGFATLYIASKLAADGDTFTVLQAVLDTQFWLATHVVVINLGYAATFLAGLLSLMYIVLGVATPSLTPSVEKDMTRMIYGTLCFGIIFSFVGTVLGGLWADDSWGRFWGWDPKENGALMIVLWNALVLHARWDGLVKGRGMAVLAVGGNIVTAWSWFGVNELGVGLHSYGLSEGRLRYLAVFVLSQLLVIAFGLLPRDLWWSHTRRDSSVA